MTLNNLLWLSLLMPVTCTTLTPALAADDGPADALASTQFAACSDGQCAYRVTPQQMLAMAEQLVAQKKYEEARPLVEALGAAPDMALPYNFLGGMIAVETGDTDTAIAKFRRILENNPGQSRVRLELARALLISGDRSGADYHLRLAENDDTLPEEIARTIRNTRSILRSQRNWRFGFDVGFAPDSNINNATNAETVDVNFGPIRLPLQLDDNARSRSGVGQTASVYGSLRLPTTDALSIVIDADASGINYAGKDSDDYSGQLAIGPELRLSRRASVSLQAVSQYRYYGGRLAARQFGGKLGLQTEIGTGNRIGAQIDVRHNDSGFGEGYSGWQLGTNVTFEKIVAKTMVASVSVFGRREFLNQDSYANTSYGANIGIGGELPLGINGGISGGISRARYDEPQSFYSSERRNDWRYSARVYAGLRQVRLLGFSPSVEYTFSKVDSNYTLNTSQRHRGVFKLARYF